TRLVVPKPMLVSGHEIHVPREARPELRVVARFQAVARRVIDDDPSVKTPAELAQPRTEMLNRGAEKNLELTWRWRRRGATGGRSRFDQNGRPLNSRSHTAAQRSPYAVHE